jgi:hypothetical protein
MVRSLLKVALHAHEVSSSKWEKLMCARDYWSVLTILLGLNSSISSLIAEDRYYMLVFGAQSEPNLPRLTHVHALFVHASHDKWGSQRIHEQHCISWLPQSLSVEPLRRTTEPGVNLGLAETNRHYVAMGSQIAMWGPIRIKKELYDMAAKQAERLNRNEISYICLDWRHRGAGASNCHHAVSDLDTTQPPLVTGTARGHGAALLVVQHFARYALPSSEDTRWLTERLNLKPTEVRFVTPQA